MRRWFDSKLFPSVSIYPDGRLKMVNERFRAMFLPNSDSYHGIPFSGLLKSKEVDLMMRSLVALNQSSGTQISLIFSMSTMSSKIEVIEWEFLSHAQSEDQVDEITAIGRIREPLIHSAPYSNSLVYHQRYLDALVDLFFIVDRNFRLISVNRKFERYFQLNRVNWLGVNLNENPIPGMHHQLLKSIDLAILLNQPNELLISDFDGMAIVKYKVAIVNDGVLVLGRDVTPCYANSEKLKRSKQKLDAILNSTTDSNLLISPEGYVLSFNKVSEIEMRTVFKKELKIGSHIESYLIPKLIEDFRKTFEKVLEGEIVVKEVQLNLGSYSAWYEIKYQPVYAENGELIGVSFNSRYIDSYKQLLEQLKNRTEILNAVFNSTQSALIILNYQGEITYLNQVAEWLLVSQSGYPVKEGDALFGLLPAQYGHVCKQKWELSLRGNHASLEMELESHLHGTQYYQVQFHPVKDQEGKQFGVSMVLINRTHQHQQLERLAAQNRTLAKITEVCSESWPIPIRVIRELEEQIRLTPDLAPRLLPALLKQARKLDQMIYSVNKMIAETSFQDFN